MREGNIEGHGNFLENFNIKSGTNIILASCPWGPATAHGLGTLTEMYVIYIEGHTSHRGIAQCFGLGFFFSNLAPCQPHWQTANTVTLLAGCQCCWQGAKCEKNSRLKHRVIARCEVYNFWMWFLTNSCQEHCKNEVHYKFHLSTLFPKRNETFHCAFLLMMSVNRHWMCGNG